MMWIVLPALIALLLKMRILIGSWNQDWASREWLGLVIVYACFNLSEVLVYGAIEFVKSPHALLVTYYVCGNFCIAFGQLYVANGDVLWQRLLTYWMFVAAIVISLFEIFTTHFIAGYVVGSMPVVAAKGSYFVYYVIFALTSCVLTFYTLIFNYVRSKDREEKTKYGYTILGLIPIALTVSGTLLFISLGINANGSMVIPLATTLFLFITARGRVQDQLRYDIQKYLSPKLEQSKVAWEIEELYSSYLKGDIDYKFAKKRFGQLLLRTALAEHSGNISQAARSAEVARSVFYDPAFDEIKEKTKKN